MGPTRADAEPCESRFGGGAVIEPAEVAERYAYIEATLRTERRKGRIWNHAWGWGLLAAAGGQVGAVYLNIDGIDDCDPCLWIGAGKSLLGVGATFITNPVRVQTVAKNSAPTCDDLAEAEKKLEKAAKSERVHWMRRVEGYGVNTAALLYLGFVEDEWYDGAWGFAISVIVGELRLYTRPDGAVSGLRHYKVRATDARKGGDDFAWTAAPLLTDEGFGLGVLGVF